MFDRGDSSATGTGSANAQSLGTPGTANDAVDSISGVLTALMRFDPMAADRTELQEAVDQCARVRAWVDSVEIGVSRRIRQIADPAPDPGDGGQGAPHRGTGGRSGETDATDLLGNKGKRDRNRARASARRSIVCDRYPDYEDALVNGAITSAHLDIMMRALQTLNDADRSEFDTHASHLLDIAVNDSLHEFKLAVAQTLEAINPPESANERLERQRNRSQIKRWQDHITGMFHLHAELDPESGAKVSAALDAHLNSLRQREETSGLSFQRVEAMSFTQLITESDHTALQRIPEVCVHIDLQTLIDGSPGLAELSDGTPLPIDTVRRLCCNAEIHPMFMAGTHCLAHGRAIRTANREQRRALRSMYRTCGIPSCTVAFERCEMHHVTPWQTAGATDLDNLLPVCSRHHHQIHDERWLLSMTADRVVTYRSPDGQHTTTADTTDRSRSKASTSASTSTKSTRSARSAPSATRTRPPP
jgi:hypothetical protein